MSVHLEQIMRQQGNTVEQQRFRELLLRLRDATSEFASAIHLYPTTEAVSEHNITRLKQNEQPIAHIKAVHHWPDACKASLDEASGLEASITLATGATVMLISNIWIETGLVSLMDHWEQSKILFINQVDHLIYLLLLLYYLTTIEDLHCMITLYPLVLYKEIGYIMANVAQDYSFHCG